MRRSRGSTINRQEIRALWIALARAGALRDSSETALRHFVKRVSGQDALAWLGAADANKVIEALKAMMRRAHYRRACEPS